MNESTVENYLKKKIKELGGDAYKFVSPGTTGMPDRLICLPKGVAMFVETKAPGKKARPRQERQMEKLRAFGFSALVLDNKDAVDDYIKYLEHLGY